MGLRDWLSGKKAEPPAPPKMAIRPVASRPTPLTDQPKLTRWQEILLLNTANGTPGLGLTDPNHPARKWIDEASEIANQASIVVKGGKPIVEAIPPQFLSVVEKAIEKAPNDPDLLVAKAGALFWFAQVKEAEQVIDSVLSTTPSHFQARQLKNYSGTWPDLFCYPAWTERSTRLHHAMALDLDRSRSVQLVRDGLRIGIAVVRDATGIKMPKPLTDTMPHKWEVLWSETPYSPVVAHYLLVEDDPAQPFRTEGFLPTFVPDGGAAESGFWLLQRASQINSCFLVITRGDEVLFNVRYTFPPKLVSTLREIAENCARRSLKTNEGFAAAQQWHMDNFDMKQIQFALPALLAEIATELKSSRQLPVRRLCVKELMGKPRIAWSYTRGGEDLNRSDAETLLKTRIPVIGLRLGGCGGYTSDDNGASSVVFWDYSPATTTGSGYQREVERLSKLEREAALKEGAQLIADGNFNVVLAWLCQGEYYGIPADLLANCGKQEAADKIISLLRDPSHDIRTRAARSLGPLGGEDAAKALCANLPNAERDEHWRIADALEKIAWFGAIGPLTEAVSKSRDSSVRAALAKAIVRCGDRDKGLNLLYEGLSDDAGSNDYANALSKLDKDDLTDSRFLPEMLSLIERTKNSNSKEIVMQAIFPRHQDKWETIERSRALTPTRTTPSKKVSPFNGEVVYSLLDASAITGISVREIQKLIKDRRVFACQIAGEWRVSLYGSYPCGELLDHPDPRHRSIGAKQD